MSRYVTVKRSGLILLAIGCVWIGSCFSCGCMIDAGKLAGFSNPKLRMNYNGGRGTFDMEAGTDFQGKAQGHYNPETKKIEASIEIGSSVSPVVQAEGTRAESLVELRRIEATMLVEMHKAVGENIRAFGDAAKNIGGAIARVETAKEGPTLTGSLWTIIKVLIGVIVAVTLAKTVWGYFVKPTKT